MTDQQMRVWRGPKYEAARIVCIAAGGKQINVAFTPDDVRRPRRVRHEIFHAMRTHFPDYQRLIPRKMMRGIAPQRRATWR